MAGRSVMTRLCNYWFTPVNNSPLIVFRMLFGAVMLMEFADAIFSGWVRQVYIDAPFRFTFIGFEFLEYMHGPGMYVYYVAACILAVMVMTGFFYRPAAILMAVMWTLVYFSQKSHYNNHYYLMMLICWLMTIVPAGRRASVDVKLGRVKASNECYRWCLQLFIIQIAIVYTYASIAKIYPDWLHAMPVKIWFAKNATHPRLGFLFGNEAFAYFVAYGGILFDLLIVPALLWKRTRTLAVVAMLIFHQFNKMVFGIGVFPYLAMSLNVFFFPGKTFDHTVGIESRTFEMPYLSAQWQKIIVYLLCLYISWQVLTPLRHHLYKADVVWTEEGHRMSWRMMLRSKTGDAVFRVKDKNSDSAWTELPINHLLKYQERTLSTRPDFIWQFAQHLRDIYRQKGYDVSVYATCYCSLNGRPKKLLVDPNVDLAAEKWHAFKHNNWILTDYK